MTKRNPGTDVFTELGHTPAQLGFSEPADGTGRTFPAEVSTSEISRQWTQVVTLLRKELGESTYQNWLCFMGCEGIDGGCVQLTAPSRFKRD